MNKREKEKRLDELISRTINTEKPQFDVEKWKQKYPDEFQALLSRTANGDSARRPNILKVIRKSPLAKLAAAAVIIIAISFFVIHQGSPEQVDTTTVSKTPAEMMTAMSLTITYRKGGMEAVEEQYNEAYKQLGPRPRNLSVEQILAEFNGT